LVVRHLRRGVRTNGVPLTFGLAFLPCCVPALPFCFAFLPSCLPTLSFCLPAFLPSCLAVVDSKNHLPDFHLVALLDFDLADRSRHRRRHFDRGLVGLELEDRLIHRERVARLDQQAQDVAGRHVLTKLWQREIRHSCAPRQWLTAEC